MPNEELNKKINIINNASKELYNHKDVLFKTIIKLNDEIYDYNFINKLKYSDEFAELNVWGSKFKITWYLKVKKDSDGELNKQDFSLIFSVNLISSNKKYRALDNIDDFTITYDKQILYRDEETLRLDINTDILRLFNLIFEKYFNMYIQEITINMLNVEI